MKNCEEMCGQRIMGRSENRGKYRKVCEPLHVSGRELPVGQGWPRSQAHASVSMEYSRGLPHVAD